MFWKKYLNILTLDKFDKLSVSYFSTVKLMRFKNSLFAFYLVIHVCTFFQFKNLGYKNRLMGYITMSTEIEPYYLNLGSPTAITKSKTRFGSPDVKIFGKRTVKLQN